jgi:hypothetical protein
MQESEENVLELSARVGDGGSNDPGVNPTTYGAPKNGLHPT